MWGRMESCAPIGNRRNPYRPAAPIAVSALSTPHFLRHQSLAQIAARQRVPPLVSCSRRYPFRLMVSANPFYLPSCGRSDNETNPICSSAFTSLVASLAPSTAKRTQFSLPPLPAQWLHPCISDETNPILPSSVRGSVAPPREKCEKKVENRRRGVAQRPLIHLR